MPCFRRPWRCLPRPGLSGRRFPRFRPRPLPCFRPLWRCLQRPGPSARRFPRFRRLLRHSRRQLLPRLPLRQRPGSPGPGFRPPARRSICCCCASSDPRAPRARRRARPRPRLRRSSRWRRCQRPSAYSHLQMDPPPSAFPRPHPAPRQSGYSDPPQGPACRHSSFSPPQIRAVVSTIWTTWSLSGVMTQLPFTIFPSS